MNIEWEAMSRALNFYEQEISEKMLHDWLLDNWGIKSGDTFIEVVDEKKYTAFLLRFA